MSPNVYEDCLISFSRALPHHHVFSATFSPKLGTSVYIKLYLSLIYCSLVPNTTSPQISSCKATLSHGYNILTLTWKIIMLTEK